MTTEFIGNIPVHTLKQDYIRVYNSKQYDLQIKQINPLDVDYYIDYWRRIKKLIVEGMWGTEPGGYRYCPGSLVFYKNFGKIQVTDENKTTHYVNPFVQDIEWELAYMFLEAEGFSGFYNDEEHTSDKLVLTYDKNFPTTQRERCLYNAKGELKKYIPARENIKRLHEYNKGQCLYFNEASNISILGSRGGGKSYFVALAIVLRYIIIDGANYYCKNTAKYFSFCDYKEAFKKDKLIVETMIGSGDTDKSSEIISKIVGNMEALSTDHNLGVWESLGHPDYAPCPLFKDMNGSTSPSNKENPWRHEVTIIKNGRKQKEGSKSKLYHVSYSTQKGKGKGSQAGSGGRVKVSVVEESGITENTIAIHNSNNSVVAREGVQFGIQVDIGTSGNIEAIPQTRKKFINPQDYNILAYPDTWENMGKEGMIGYFLPFYLTLRQYKDEDGNTDYVKAFSHIFELRKEKANATDPSVLKDEKMNRPIVPSEMWLSSKGYYLPHEEAVEREKVLSKNNHYLELANPVKLIWDQNALSGVRYELNPESEPLYEYPVPDTLTSFDSSVIIYDFPTHQEPNDYYFITLDTYISENIDDGGSFGAAHVWINPKYWENKMKVSPMVATFIAKPTKGLKYFYETIDKLLAFYGNPVRGLAYEANRGEDCKNYFTNKNKTHLLVLRPSVHDRSSVFLARVTEYGYLTLDKRQMLDRLNDLLKSEVPYFKTDLISTIPCLFTIKQIVNHDIKENLDAVSSIMIAPTHMQVLETEFENQQKDKAKKNELAFLSTNPFINANKKYREYPR